MIFVTVGHQMPFDRLIRAVDDWAERCGRSDLFAQIGETDCVPRNFQSTKFLTPAEFRQHMEQASAIVGHAGTGTIIAALQLGKPLLVLPRLARLSETRNDHQVPTARYFETAGRILAAYDVDELHQKMYQLEAFRPQLTINGHASPELIQTLRDFSVGVHA